MTRSSGRIWDFLRRKSLPKRMLVSIHIPKTGGTTLSEILRANFRRMLLISDEHGIRDFMQMSPDRRSSYPAAAGHMTLGIDRYVTVPCQYIVFLREPIDHTVSAYYYLLRTPTNPQYERGRKMNLREYVESDLWLINDNLQTRWLSGFDWADVMSGRSRPSSPCTEEHLRRAKANLDRCDFVGLFNRFEKGVQLCCERFGLRCTTIPRLNATGERPALEDVDPEVRAIIRERRRFDLELYQYAVRRCAG
jgi:hypothetical protein